MVSFALVISSKTYRHCSLFFFFGIWVALFSEINLNIRKVRIVCIGIKHPQFDASGNRLDPKPAFERSHRFTDHSCIQREIYALSSWEKA